jgi:hypothetical protein
MGSLCSDWFLAGAFGVKVLLAYLHNSFAF